MLRFLPSPLPYFLCLALGLQACLSPSDQEESQRPNLIVILADDMGYSDLGCYGSGIRTPHLDRLAREGLRMTQFYNAGRCCPSRASLLMGRYPHGAGVATMTDYTLPDHPAYQGYLRQDAPTVAEMLQNAGYHTFQAGKWHVGGNAGQLPLDRGFDHAFTFVGGAGSYFDFQPYRNDQWPYGGAEIRVLKDRQPFPEPDSFYLTDLFTDFAVQYVERGAQSDDPFFLYLAYTAPHWPLHAPAEDIARYEGRFLGGWDSVRQARHKRLQALGLLDSAALSPRFEKVIPWREIANDSLRQRYDRQMAVYAAMIDRMDQQIGRLLSVLEEAGQAENTLILFLSDNGASRAEHTGYLHPRFDPQAPIGTPASFWGYGVHWANASDVPWRRFKGETHEGGIATPFIAWWPDQIPTAHIEREAYAHICDLLPTLGTAAGAQLPAGLDGINLLDLLREGQPLPERELYFEHYGRRAIRKGDWKLVSLANQPWELYRMDQDRCELRNLAAIYPDTVAQLQAQYQAWARSAGVLPVNELHRRYQAQLEESKPE